MNILKKITIGLLVFLLVLIIIISFAPETEKTVNLEEMTTKEYITYCINKGIGEKTNNSKNRIITVEEKILTNSNLEYNLNINADDNLTIDLTKKGLWLDTIKFYKELIKQDEKISKIFTITINFTQTLTDTYGNNNENKTMQITLSNETINKTNWDNLLTDNLPKIADEYWQHNIYN